MRDWRELPYWGTEVEVERSIAEIQRLLHKRGVEVFQVSQRYNPWGIMLGWEMSVEAIPVMVSFDLLLETDELRGMTPKQAEAVPRQAMRLLFYTIKNLLAAVDCGIMSMESAFMAKFQTYRDGFPVSVGDLLVEQIKNQGALGPTIRLALPAGGKR
jgi:hypothetical protein